MLRRRRVRPLELASILALSIALLAQALRLGRRTARRGLFAAVAALLIAQAAVEGARVQLGVAYLLLAVGLIRLLQRRAEPPRAGALQAAGRTALAALGCAAAAGLPLILPVPELPAPPGPHRIGTVTFEIEDPRRADDTTTTGRRRFVVQAWYPASDAAADLPPAPYAPGVAHTAPALARALGVPAFLFGHLTLARSHAREGAAFEPSIPAAPIIIFSHGLGTSRSVHTAAAEALAGAGFVVLGIDHTRDAAAVSFSDGTVVLGDRRVPDGASDEEAARLKAQWTRARADDVRALLDAMPRALPAALAGHVDLRAIGIAGHSLGGSTAIEACRTDDRLKACADLDGKVYGEAAGASLAQPFLRTESEPGGAPDALSVKNAGLLAAFDARTRGPACLLHVRGARHLDFSDLPALSPILPYLTAGAAREGSAATLAGTNDALTGFFSATLRGDRAGWSRVQAPRPRFEAKCARLTP